MTSSVKKLNPKSSLLRLSAQPKGVKMTTSKSKPRDLPKTPSPKSGQRDIISNIDADVRFLLLKAMSYKDIVNLCSTSTSWRDFCSEPMVEKLKISKMDPGLFIKVYPTIFERYGHTEFMEDVDALQKYKIVHLDPFEFIEIYPAIRNHYSNEQAFLADALEAQKFKIKNLDLISFAASYKTIFRSQPYKYDPDFLFDVWVLQQNKIRELDPAEYCVLKPELLRLYSRDLEMQKFLFEMEEELNPLRDVFKNMGVLYLYPEYDSHKILFFKLTVNIDNNTAELRIASKVPFEGFVPVENKDFNYAKNLSLQNPLFIFKYAANYPFETKFSTYTFSPIYGLNVYTKDGKEHSVKLRCSIR